MASELTKESQTELSGRGSLAFSNSDAALARTPAFSFNRSSASSRDEMNLAEFPLAVLSTRANPSVKTLEFKDQVRLPTGESIERKWIITGTDKFGLPTATDDDVVLGLIRMTMDQGFRDPKVYFTRYELLKSLRWSTEGRSYSRLIKSLDRLSGVRIRSTNSFYDNNSKSYQTCNFGIIDAYEINDQRSSRQLTTRQLTSGTTSKSYFIWSEMIFDSFKAGFVKKLDLDFYFALKSAVSRRLYRYLDKHFYYKSSLEISLTTLAFEKVGISRNHKYISSIKQQLEPAAQELVQMGFLAGYDFVGRGAQTTVKFFARSASGSNHLGNNSGRPNSAGITPEVDCSSDNGQPLAEAGTESLAQSYKSSIGSNSSSQNQNGNQNTTAPKQFAVEQLAVNLCDKLMKRGISPIQAKRLLQQHSEFELQKTERIIDYFDRLVATADRRISKSPAGFLYRAVEEPNKFVLPEERALRGGAGESLGASARLAENQTRNHRGRPELKIFTAEKPKASKVKAKSLNKNSATDGAINAVDPQFRDFVDSEVTSALSQLNAEQIAALRYSAESKVGFLKDILGQERFHEAIAGCFREEVIRAFGIPSQETWQRQNKPQ